MMARLSHRPTYRDILHFADAAERLGGCTIRKEMRTVPASNFIGLLSLQLDEGDEVEVLDSGGKAWKIVRELVKTEESICVK